jgi:hypothetical protein
MTDTRGKHDIAPGGMVKPRLRFWQGYSDLVDLNFNAASVRDRTCSLS